MLCLCRGFARTTIGDYVVLIALLYNGNGRMSTVTLKYKEIFSQFKANGFLYSIKVSSYVAKFKVSVAPISDFVAKKLASKQINGWHFCAFDSNTHQISPRWAIFKDKHGRSTLLCSRDDRHHVYTMNVGPLYQFEVNFIISGNLTSLLAIPMELLVYCITHLINNSLRSLVIWFPFIT